MQAVIKFSFQSGLLVSFFSGILAFGAPIEVSSKLNLSELFTPLLVPSNLAEDLQKGWDQGGESRLKAFLKFKNVHKKNLEKIDTALLNNMDLSRNLTEEVKQGLLVWSLCQLAGLEIESEPVRYQQMLYLPLKLSLEMTFSESSIDQLRWGYQFRDRFLILVKRQLEEKKSVLLGSQALIGFNSLRWIWPVDRVLLNESKLKVEKKAWPLSQKIISEIQKNPYQSIQAVMRVKKWESKSIQDWSLVWTEQDVKNLRSELTTVSQLQLYWAVLRYKSKENKEPDSQQTLIKAGFLSVLAIDFFSGLPLPLPRL